MAPLICALAGAVSADTRFTQRDGGPSESEMLSRGDAGLSGRAFVRPVLDGVRYRAGFKVDPKLRITAEQRGQICP